MKRKNCCQFRFGCRQTGIILISLGAGIFLAYIIPYYLLIAMLGCALIGFGIRYILRK